MQETLTGGIPEKCAVQSGRNWPNSAKRSSSSLKRSDTRAYTSFSVRKLGAAVPP